MAKQLNSLKPSSPPISKQDNRISYINVGIKLLSTWLISTYLSTKCLFTGTNLFIFGISDIAQEISHSVLWC